MLKNTAVFIQKPTGTFRVASYNVHRFVGLDHRFDPQRVARVIRELDADIVGVQEIDTRYFKGGGKDQIELLKDSTGMDVLLGPTTWRHDSFYGNALFTKHPVVNVRRVDLSVPGRRPRGALDVDLQIEGRLVRVIVAHLGLSRLERHRQVRWLCRMVYEQDDRLKIMMGDFNEWLPRSRPLWWIHDVFGKAPAHFTFPSFFPILALDRIWVKPNDALLATRVHVSRLSRVASDHLPIEALVALPVDGQKSAQEDGNYLSCASH